MMPSTSARRCRLPAWSPLLLAMAASCAPPAGLMASEEPHGGDGAQTAQAIQLQGIQVKGRTTPVRTDARVATKTDTPLIETPQAVTVISSEELTTRAVQSLDDALNYTAGTSSNGAGTDQRYDWPSIRGFSAGSFGIYLDGLRFQPGSFVGRIEPYFLDSVAILKGPSSVLYGQNSPGGLIDAVSKLPTSTPLHEIGIQYGSFQQRQLKGDFSGPLDQAGHWLYRLTLVSNDNNTQIDRAYNKRLAIAPSLTWRPNDDTRLTLQANFQRDLTNSLYPFMPAQGSVLFNPNGTISTALDTGDPHFDSYRRSQTGIGYQFFHRFNSVWSLSQNLRVERMTVDWRQMYSYGSGLIDNDRAFNRVAFHETGWTNNYTVDTRGQALFDTGAIHHSALIGVDFGESPGYQNEFAGLATPLNLFAPVYSRAAPSLPLHEIDEHLLLKQTGVYVQDQLKWGEHWVALLGLRHDWASTSTANYLADNDSDLANHKTTGRAGLVYLTSSGLAPYISWSTSFLPNSGADFSGRPFAPTTGRQLEGGLKYQPTSFDGMLTLSGFDIHQSNVLVSDPLHPQFQAAAGEIRSRGVELEAVAHLSDSLLLRGAYTYDQVRDIRDSNPAALGKPPTTIPMHSASIWADYTVQQGVWREFGFGGGVRRVGDTYGGVYNPIAGNAVLTRPIEVPAFTLFDAQLHYLIGGFRLALNANNLFDKHYVAGCYGALSCSYGLRRMIMASASYRW